jgi:hypothetical protein
VLPHLLRDQLLLLRQQLAIVDSFRMRRLSGIRVPQRLRAIVLVFSLKK